MLHDAVNTVVGSETKFEGMPAGTRAVALPDNSFNASNYFLTVFGRPEASSACECERSLDASLSQALHLLNSKDIQAKIASDQGRAALLVSDAKSDDAARLRSLYWIAFSREPSASEIEFAAGYIATKAGAAKDDAARAKARREARTSCGP